MILVLITMKLQKMIYLIFTSIWWWKMAKYKMFKLIKKLCFTGLTFLSTLTSVNPLRCVSVNNQECKVR